MLVSEQIESVDREELKQQNHIHKDTECSEETTIYGHINQHMEKTSQIHCMKYMMLLCHITNRNSQ